MKKRKMKLFALSLALLLMAGCGQKQEESAPETVTEQDTEASSTETAQKNVIYLSQLDVAELVELGTYKGVEVEGGNTEVPESMVDSYLEYTLSLQSTLEEVTDRDTVEDGDVVNIDYEGKKDGVAFDGGTAAGYNLEIGSGSFIEGFEEGLIGVKKGETVDLNLTFPINYPAEDLAGAKVVFTVTVNQIQAYAEPTLNDEYVAALGIEGVSTVEEYRAQVHEMLSQQMQEEYEYQLQVSVIEKVMEGSQIQEPSEELRQKYADVALEQTQRTADYYGMDLETFVKNYYYVELTEYQKEIEAGAYEAARQAMLCKRIADVEGIEITDEELETAALENYASFGFDSVEAFKEANDMEEFRDSMLLDKVLGFLVDNAVIVEKTQESIAETEAAAEETTEAE